MKLHLKIVIAASLIVGGVVVALAVSPASTAPAIHASGERSLAKPEAASDRSPIIYNGVNQADLQECTAAAGNCLETVPGLGRCVQQGLNCNDSSAQPGGEEAQVQPPNSELLTESQAIAKLGWPASNVAGELSTYGQLKQQMPELAESDVVNPKREFWALTLYETQSVSADAAYGPPSSSSPRTISAETFLVDASSGTVTDECLGCAYVAIASSS
jgi:hypothetical protein